MTFGHVAIVQGFDDEATGVPEGGHGGGDRVEVELPGTDRVVRPGGSGRVGEVHQPEVTSDRASPAVTSSTMCPLATS